MANKYYTVIVCTFDFRNVANEFVSEFMDEFFLPRLLKEPVYLLIKPTNELLKTF